MIATILAIIILSCIIGLCCLMFLENSYDSYVISLAEEYTFEEIEDKIDEISHVLEKGNFKGEMLENYLNDMDLWLMVRERKKELEK